jgi:predicted DNA-binding protein with PD1-like motif
MRTAPADRPEDLLQRWWPVAMKTALLHEIDGLRTIALILEQGEEAAAALAAFAVEHRLGGSHFTAVGAFSHATVAYFDWPTKRYRHIPIDEQVEVLSLVGDIVIERDVPKVHGHVVLGRSDASACGGHLIEGHVRPTLEVIVTETPRHLRRRFDPESKLALIDPAAK